jgi:hypothetical protein
MSEATDPFSQIDAALWAQAEADADFTASVRAGNRRRTGVKVGRLPADAPEVDLFPVPGGAIDLFQTSSSSRFIQNFAFAVKTQTQTPAEGIFPIKWILIRAMAQAQDKLGLPELVTKVRFTDSVETRENELARNGWQMLLGVTVEFRVANTSLQT